MISYKKDVLERQSLAEVKMGRGSPICERVRTKIVEYFKNNIPQCQIAKALQISSSTVHNIIKDSEKLEKSFFSIELCWIPVVFRQSDDTASLICMILSLTLLKGPRKNFQKPLQMPNKAISRKKESICEQGPEAPLCPLGQGSFKVSKWKSVP